MKIREPLIKATRAAGERFFGTTRRDFAGIIVFISRNHNAVVAEKIRQPPKAIDSEVPQVYLILNLFEQAGIEGLELKHPTGRQRKLSDEQEQELCSVITENYPKMWD